MSLTLRDYQQEAIDAVAQAFAKGAKRPLCVAPTASGKSILLAGIASRFLAKDKSRRVLVLCSTQEILKQNESVLNKFDNSISTGIYCAGAGRKDTKASVIFASRDSLGRCPTAAGMFDFIMVDEAHQVATDCEKSDKTMYGRIFAEQNPKWALGLTGTPWRLSGGNIWGEGKFFDKIAYNIPMRLLINRSFLSAYTFPPTDAKIDTSNLKVASTGDFTTADLESVAGGRAITERAVSEWMRRASTRRCSLFFCVSRAHGKLLTEVLEERIGAGNVLYIDGESKGRAGMVDAIKRGKYRAVINIGTLTTGFDAPIIDCVVFLRPTASASLFVQMSGRALRTFPGKSDALFLDFAGNFDRFRSIETPKVNSQHVREEAAEQPEEREDAPKKPCPCCGFQGLSMRATFCPYCGEVFVKKLNRPFSGKHEPQLFQLMRWSVSDYMSKAGNFCKRVTYFTDRGLHSEYFAVLNGGYAQRKYEERMDQLRQKPYALIAQVDGGLIKIEQMLTEAQQ